MRGVVIDLNSDAADPVFQNEVSVSVVLVDVIKGILGIQIPGLLRPKGIGEQPDKQILAVAAGIRCILH